MEYSRPKCDVAPTLAGRLHAVRFEQAASNRSGRPRARESLGKPRALFDARRFVDVLAALAGGLLSLPFMVTVALTVRLSLGSPVLFRQSRAGQGGRPFQLVKFRTMSDARDAAGRPLPDEARLGAFGRLLRRSRLDELPELWNIAKGEMAFVGPRPLLPETVAGFGEAGHRRGTVRPGLTGWAQVNGNTLLAGDDKLALDLWYVDHRSWLLDARIVLKTLGVVLRGERIAVPELEEARRHACDRRRGG